MIKIANQYCHLQGNYSVLMFIGTNMVILKILRESWFAV